MRPAEISEFLFAVQRDGVPINMIMDMRFICVRTNKESVFAFEKARGEIITDLVCLLRCHFPRLEGLAYLVNEHIVLFFLAGKMLILPFRH